jgi:hypothetical protein
MLRGNFCPAPDRTTSHLTKPAKYAGKSLVIGWLKNIEFDEKMVLTRPDIYV